jgi:hypothetical protein
VGQVERLRLRRKQKNRLGNFRGNRNFQNLDSPDISVACAVCSIPPLATISPLTDQYGRTGDESAGARIAGSSLKRHGAPLDTGRPITTNVSVAAVSREDDGMNNLAYSLLRLLVAGMAFVTSVHPLAAHHSFAAEFDAAKPFKLTGAVTEVQWTNPHAWVRFDVTDAATQKVTNWAVEMNSPNALLRAGWRRDTLKPGDVITVEGSLAKDGSPTGNARSVVVSSTGQRLFTGSSQESIP